MALEYECAWYCYWFDLHLNNILYRSGGRVHVGVYKMKQRQRQHQQQKINHWTAYNWKVLNKNGTNKNFINRKAGKKSLQIKYKLVLNATKTKIIIRTHRNGVRKKQYGSNENICCVLYFENIMFICHFKNMCALLLSSNLWMKFTC